MTDDKDISRTYSQDRQTYRHNSISITRRTSTQSTRTSEKYSSSRNYPEILSVLTLTNKHLEDREKQIYHSLSNNTHYFNTINYPIQSPPATSVHNLVLEKDKQPKFPKVISRIPSTTVKKFPSLTSRSTSIIDDKTPMPIIKTSVKSISSSFNKPLPTPLSIVAMEKKKKIQL